MASTNVSPGVFTVLLLLAGLLQQQPCRQLRRGSRHGKLRVSTHKGKNPLLERLDPKASTWGMRPVPVRDLGHGSSPRKELLKKIRAASGRTRGPHRGTPPPVLVLPAGSKEPALGACIHSTARAHTLTTGFLCSAGNNGFDQHKIAELIVMIF